MEKLSLYERLSNWARRSVTLKLISIGILILILLIPSSMLNSLIYERQQMRDAAIEEVSSKWGGAQTIGGPVLTIPFQVSSKDDKGRTEVQINYAHFLPEQLKITGTVSTEKRYRGIYEVVLYHAKLHLSGIFNYPDLAAINLSAGDCLFKDAFINVGISDMKGIKEAVNFKLNDTVYSFNPGLPVHHIFSSGASVKIALPQKKENVFDFDLDLNGSTSLDFLPFGKVTTVDLKSAWGSPSFEGSFLPVNREINQDGFGASWKVLQLNRNYPQQGIGNFIKNTDESSIESFSPFGVKLLLPIDEYQKTTRSVKYCTMFILITFLTFFFVEILNEKRIHPVQYLLVGFSICVFYVLLLSISEHLKFNISYLISCIATLILIALYARSIFRNKRLTLIFTGLLALLYGFFFSLLQLEDYSLLLGSLGLFIIIGTIMYLTRKLDWYDISSGKDPQK